MNTRTALGVAGVVAVAVAIGVVAGLGLGGGPGGGGDAGETLTVTPAATPEPTATPVLATVSPTTTPAPTPTGTPEAAVPRSAVEYHVYRRVSYHRTSRGYDRLELSDPLRKVARYHSEEMAREGYLGHEGPRGETLSARLERFGVDCESSTELVGRAPYDTPVEAENGTTIRYRSAEDLARAIVQDWMAGESLRGEILRFEWTVAGVGVDTVDRAGTTVVYATLDICQT